MPVLEDSSRLLITAITATFAQLDLGDDDAAAVKLAEKYAVALDEARAIDRAANRVLLRVEHDAPADADLHDEVAALRQKLSARTALVAIGARLESLLNDLGATPAGRAKAARGKVAAPIGPSALRAFRGGRSG
jgi:hypothetical protein